MVFEAHIGAHGVIIAFGLLWVPDRDGKRTCVPVYMCVCMYKCEFVL